MSPISNTRLLWLTQNYHPSRGGMAQSCDRIVDGLRERDLSVDVAHFTGRVVQPEIQEKRHGRYISCPVGNDSTHAMNLLWNLLEREQQPPAFSHVVAFGGMLPVLGGPVFAAWLDASLITLIRGNDFDSAVFSPRRRDLLREAMEHSSQVCVVSRDKLYKISRLYPNTPLTWIPNGLDQGNWQPLPSDREKAARWRAETVAEKRLVLGMFGHIKQKKGGLFFLETLLTSGYAERFHLLFIGEIEEVVLTWLNDNAQKVAYTMLPFLERYDLLPYYIACDMVVIASYYDGMPNVMLEAGALGIPLLASTAGGMGDFLQQDIHGFMFHPGDRHGCRSAIQHAIEASSKQLSDLGQNCRSLVLSRLNQELEIDQYLQVLEDTHPQRTTPIRTTGIAP